MICYRQRENHSLKPRTVKILRARNQDQDFKDRDQDSSNWVLRRLENETLISRITTLFIGVLLFQIFRGIFRWQTGLK